MAENQVKIIWMYPSVLNLHGDRGNVMALSAIGKSLGMNVVVERLERPGDPLNLSDADLLFFPPGQIRNMPAIVDALHVYKDELADYRDRGGAIVAIGNSGCVLAKETKRWDGSRFKGLGLLPMSCRERDSVYGDDIWYKTRNENLEILGCQIQIIDTILDEGAEPFGTLVYGRGNCGKMDEGCRVNNVWFTNALGPLFVKNPRLAALALKNASGIEPRREPDTEYEDQSAEMIRRFIKKKMNG